MTTFDQYGQSYSTGQTVRSNTSLFEKLSRPDMLLGPLPNTSTAKIPASTEGGEGEARGETTAKH